MKERCELTDLLKENCAHCRGDVLGDEIEQKVLHTFALFASRCPGCGDEIIVGDPLVKTLHGPWWVCVDCGEKGYTRG